MNLQLGTLDKKWSELSGGQRQRAIIACGLLIAYTSPLPCLLLCDEPTAACDPSTSLIVEKALMDSGCAIMLITHDESQARRLAHKRLLLTKLASGENEMELSNH